MILKQTNDYAKALWQVAPLLYNMRTEKGNLGKEEGGEAFMHTFYYQL